MSRLKWVLIGLGAIYMVSRVNVARNNHQVWSGSIQRRV